MRIAGRSGDSDGDIGTYVAQSSGLLTAAVCQRRDPTRRSQGAFAAAAVDRQDQRRETRIARGRHLLEHGPEFGLESNRGRVASEQDGTLFEGGHGHLFYPVSAKHKGPP